ncbi:hypothetical protein WA026_015987 [Henosepilachna vigintioctopunctata]|uniref:Uncharacterized protein n=1 Tax=Henosepilachna vigintioctopunctata TaxID=420089 RepID=A0AAW1U8H6_9CUCU
MNGKEESCNQARSQISTGGRRSVNSRPPSNLHSDCPPEQEEDSPSLGQRSISLVERHLQIEA